MLPIWDFDFIKIAFIHKRNRPKPPKKINMKIIKTLFLLFVLFVLGFLMYSYAPQKPLSEFIEKYSYPDSKFIEVQGKKVHYYKRGNGEKTLVLLTFEQCGWSM
ncbi:MAG: hypothetical protein C4K58_04155 [Flavobacteriaceae bacterium]|nr:MAG: hypothetical protein C4K58_04155 [Flavobacteriaceae bacterium]